MLYFFFLMIRLPPVSTLFPYTTLFRSVDAAVAEHLEVLQVMAFRRVRPLEGVQHAGALHRGGGRDRKSTRLNSSHPSISYAVFCLKKKNSLVTENSISILY